jgi:hypothetical protein
MKFLISSLALALATTALLAPSATSASPETVPLLPALRGSGSLLPASTSSKGKESHPQPHPRHEVKGNAGGTGTSIDYRNLPEIEDQTCYINVKPSDDVSDDMNDSQLEVPCTPEILGNCKGHTPCDVSQSDVAGDGWLFCSTASKVWKSGTWYCEWKWQCCDP